MPDVALLIDWENVYYTMRQHTEGPLPSTLSILQAILTKAASFGPVRVKLAIFGQEVSSQDDTLLMALEFTGIEPIAVAQRMSGNVSIREIFRYTQPHQDEIDRAVEDLFA